MVLIRDSWIVFALLAYQFSYVSSKAREYTSRMTVCGALILRTSHAAQVADLSHWISEASAVNVMALEFAGINAFKAIHIDRHCGRSIRHGAIRKTLYTAHLAELVMNGSLVEEVFGEAALARDQIEVLLRRKRQYKPHALTTGTVAGDGFVQIHIHGVCDGAALATAVVVCDGHCVTPGAYSNLLFLRLVTSGNHPCRFLAESSYPLRAASPVTF